MIRGALLAEVERHVTSDVVVLCDSLNYIKGYRYELFCRSRSQKTPNIVVLIQFIYRFDRLKSSQIHLDIPIEVTREWNESRPKDAQWPADLYA